MEEKKTAAEVLIEKFLAIVDSTGKMPWQCPYKKYNAFNWVTLSTYRGFNRLMLDFGEYVTAAQMREYNKSHNTDFRFMKGISWFPIAYFNENKKAVSVEDIIDIFGEEALSKEGNIGRSNGWLYRKNKEGGYERVRNILRYYNVANIEDFEDPNGNKPISKVASEEVVITLSDPKNIINDYLERENIKVEKTTKVPCYIPMTDTVQLTNLVKTEADYFSIAFHELAHSTGAAKRLNRPGVAGTVKYGSIEYAIEECIAEITAFLCLSECGIETFTTSGTMAYENQISYVQNWKERIRDFGSSFIYIVSQADRAFQYIMGMDI